MYMGPYMYIHILVHSLDERENTSNEKALEPTHMYMYNMLTLSISLNFEGSHVSLHQTFTLRLVLLAGTKFSVFEDSCI